VLLSGVVLIGMMVGLAGATSAALIPRREIV
jgi:hypothetical protein